MSNKSLQERSISETAKILQTVGDSLGNQRKCPFGQGGRRTTQTSSRQITIGGSSSIHYGPRNSNSIAIATIGDQFDKKYKEKKKCPLTK